MPSDITHHDADDDDDDDDHHHHRHPPNPINFLGVMLDRSLRKVSNRLMFFIPICFLLQRNPCSLSPCSPNRKCQNGFTDQGYRCKCRTGFTGHACQKCINCHSIFSLKLPLTTTTTRTIAIKAATATATTTTNTAVIHFTVFT